MPMMVRNARTDTHINEQKRLNSLVKIEVIKIISGGAGHRLEGRSQGGVVDGELVDGDRGDATSLTVTPLGYLPSLKR